MQQTNVPILLVTGFLGAGKTTFLNWLLREHPDTKISLILNEFGDIQLESQFIESESGGEVMELSNGCMCHVARDDVARVINYILDNAPATEYILIEASGLSDPDLIHDALRNPKITDRTRRVGTLCILDALNFEKNREEHPIVLSQAGDADVILLSKVAEAGSEKVAKVKNLLERIMMNAKVLLWDEELDPDYFLHTENSDEAKQNDASKKNEHSKHDHDVYQEFWFESSRDIDLAKFEEVMHSLPQNIVRSKGYINVSGTKMMVQYVPGDLKTFEQSWNGEDPHSAVLFLAKDLNTAKLQQTLIRCEK